MPEITTTQDQETGPARPNQPGLTPSPRLALVRLLFIPTLLVLVMLLLLLSLRNDVEDAMNHLVNLLPVGYAFGAGMVASVNPCGFFLLPSYISYHLGTEETGFDETSVTRCVLKALLLGGVATAGFVVIFAVAGGLISAGGQWLIDVFPYAGAAIGLGMVILGLWLLLTRRTLGIMAASRVTISPQRNLGNVFLFGLVYAIGSLSCTLPIFLVVVGSGLAGRSLFTAFGGFISYALGMGSILVAVTLGSALFRGAVAKWLRQSVPYVHRASALFLAGAGVYLTYYWLFEGGLLF